MHRTSEPAILDFGTPVVVISKVNNGGSTHLAPMSSAFWLGWRSGFTPEASQVVTAPRVRNSGIGAP